MTASFRTLLVEEHSRPITTIVTVLHVGTLDDPPGKEGLAYLTAEMLMRGAGTWNQAALSDEIEFLGSTLSIDVGRWTTTVTGDALSRHLDAFQSVVHTILESPRFEESEFEQLKRQTAADIVQVRENDNMLCQRFLVKQLYQDHSYGRPRKGTLDSLAAITLEDVRQFFAIHYSRFNSLTAAAGDVSENRLRNYAEDILSHLPMERPPVQNVAEVPEPSGIEAVVVDKPGRSQVPVIAGHSTIHANHPDYLALFVAMSPSEVPSRHG